MEVYKTLAFYGSGALEDAIKFYDASPDGQYDEMVAALLRAILEDLEKLSQLLYHREG